MEYGSIPGLEKRVSRLVLGVDHQVDLNASAPVMDDYLARGGNCFDTAFIYQKGVCETVLGEFVASRGIRDQVVIIGKGAHTPYCTPDGLNEQLTVSLERMGLDFVDIYALHRDNPQVPVGEFVDALNEHVRAGRMRVFGGSNWTLERLQAANEYATARGVQGFGVLSNQFSLAEMIDPIWDGCLSASSASYRAWLQANPVVLMPWSSQSRGFFVLGNPEFIEDRELERCWYSPMNFARLDRARALARVRGVEAINIALAYVLNQPFPTFPLIGPRRVRETSSSMKALEIKLTALELAWLNLESDQAPEGLESQ
jgi:aryl-alcohol dehydrogenase-like predicted oxidoreductase